MNERFKILAVFMLLSVSLTVSAQDKRDMFNPVNYAIISQTIAPDARAAGIGDVGGYRP